MTSAPAFLRPILPVLLLATAGPGIAHRTDTQFWFGESVSAVLDPATTLGVDTSQRLRETRIGADQYLSRIVLDRRVAKGVEIGAGFTWQGTGAVNEYRPHAQLTLSRGVFALRTRLEQRIIDGVDRTGWRLRERLQLAMPLDRGKRWTAVASGEGFFQLNATSAARQTGLAMIRTQIGLRRLIGDKLTLALVYQRQQQIVAGGEDVVNHAPVMTMAVRF
jgi:hypothetical protein